MVDETTSNFTISFQIFLAFLLIPGIYYILKHKNASKVYWNFAKNIAASFILIELALFLVGGTTISSFWAIFFHFISIAICVLAGMILTQRLQKPSIPILTMLTRTRTTHLSFTFFNYLKPVLIYSIMICIFTALLFKFTHPEISNFLKEMSKTEGNPSQYAVQISSIVFFLLVAFYEEIIFRLFIQTFFLYLLRKFSWGSLASILISSLIFATGHFGVLATWWVKFIQTFVIGIILGINMKKYGMETSFTIHAILNMFALYTSRFLMSF